MRSFVALLRRFHSDERGVFAVIFGILAIVLVAASGAVIDYTSMEQARTRAQVALDAAALGLQPTIFNSPAPSETSLRASALNLVVQRLNDPRLSVSIDSAVSTVTDGTLHIEGSLTVPTSFMGLIGFPSLTAHLVSEATRKRLNLEVAMVLDNSNSMSSYSRMTNLKAAAKCAMNVLLNGDCNSTATTTSSVNTKIGIVPFTLAVNIGTANKNAWWLDRTGTVGSHSARAGKSANITNDNFDNDDDPTTIFNGTVDRVALADQLVGVDWGGCVEARKYPYDTNDAPPVAGTDTMFTPYFAPDEPDSGFNNNYLSDRPNSCTHKDSGTWSKIITKTNCDRAGNNSSNYNSANCSGSTTTTYEQTNGSGAAVAASSTQPSSIDGNPASCSSYYSYQSFGSRYNRTYDNTYSYKCNYQFSDRVLQERLCKYTGATVSNISQGSVRGPNGDCPTNPITPLTSDKPTVLAAINALAPQGGTNIHAGTIWGFRVLSPTEPFTGGRQYDETTSKVMIVMTDGENTAYQTNNMNNTTYYSYYGFPWNGRLGNASSTDSQLEALMNSRLVESCASAKAEGIEIYTVGLNVEDTSNPTTITQMLKDCSSGTGYWYFPTQSSELVTVFQTIASQLANLRLAQ